MKQKAMPAGRQGFAPVLIILLIAILGVIGYFLYRGYQNKISVVSSPYPTSTTVMVTDQKAIDVATQIANRLNTEITNTNVDFKKYNYNGMSFKIPADWQTQQTSQGLLFKNFTGDFVVTIAMEKFDCYANFQEFITAVKKTGAAILNQKETTLANLPAYYVEADLPGNSTKQPQIVNYAMLGSKNVYEISTLNTGLSSTSLSLRDDIVQSISIDETNVVSASQCGK